MADDLVDAHALPEPGEPDPPGITPQVAAMTESHVAVTEACEALAAAFASDDPVPITLPDIRLIEETLSEANATLSTQLAELRQSQEALTERLQA